MKVRLINVITFSLCMCIDNKEFKQIEKAVGRVKQKPACRYTFQNSLLELQKLNWKLVHVAY